VSASGGADLGQHVWVPRVKHRTHAPDSSGCVRSHTQGGLQFDQAPDARTGPTGVRPVPYPERVEVCPLTGRDLGESPDSLWARLVCGRSSTVSR